MMEIRADRLFVDADWKRWIAENLLRGAHADELADILIREGFHESLARLEVETAAQHPYVAAAQSLGRQIRKRDWFLHVRQMMEREHGSPSIERRGRIDGETFHTEFCGLNRPVILTEMVSDWPAIRKWTPQYLRERCEDEMIQIQARRDSNPGYEIEKDAHRDSCRFGDFVQKVFFGGVSNDCYMTASNATSNSAVLDRLWNDIQMPPEITDPSGAKERTFLWIGPSGTVTPLHHDLTNNFMAQITGRKRIRIISPAHHPFIYNHRHCFSRVDIDNVDEAEFPLFRNALIHDFVLHPGELLFLPVGWWHHVVAMDPSITVTFTNFVGMNDFTDSYSTYGEI